MMIQEDMNIEREFPLNEYYSRIYRRYDLVNRLFTFGMDKRWRRKAAKECIKSDPRGIIDLCCGTGDMTLELAKQAGESIKLIGFDFNHAMLDVARKKAKKLASANLEFIQGDVGRMPFSDDEFDAITIAFGFRNLTFKNPDVHIHLSEMVRIIRKGGHLIILESGVPSSKFVLPFYKLYLRLILIPLGGLISGDWKAYKYLSQSASGYYNLDQLNELLSKYGFHIHHVTRFFFGSANLIAAVRR